MSTPPSWTSSSRAASSSSAAPLADEYRTVHVVEAGSEAEIRATFARDPWSETHLQVAAIDPWTIRLDCRQRTTH